jgi:hypothetical protein
MLNITADVDGGMMSGEDFNIHWPSIQKELDRNPAIWADYHTKESIHASVMDGSFQAWGFRKKGKIRIILLTRIVEYPAARVLHVMLAFGNSMDDLLSQIEAIMENFAQTTGCEMCEIVGRRGWLKKLKRFRERATVMTAFVPRKSKPS